MKFGAERRSDDKKDVIDRIIRVLNDLVGGRHLTLAPCQRRWRENRCSLGWASPAGDSGEAKSTSAHG
jgi:hypothetical protein